MGSCLLFSDNLWRPPPRTWARLGLSEKRLRFLKREQRAGDSRDDARNSAPNLRMSRSSHRLPSRIFSSVRKKVLACSCSDVWRVGGRHSFPNPFHALRLRLFMERFHEIRL